MTTKTRSLRLPALTADTRGTSTVEYVMLLCLVVVAGFVAWQHFGDTVAVRVVHAERVVRALP